MQNMRTRITYSLALAGCLAALPVARAQVPAPPPPPIPAIPGVPVVPAPVVAAPNNLWSFLLPQPAQCAALKAHFCASPLGMMVGAAGMPMQAFSGGLLGNCC